MRDMSVNVSINILPKNEDAFQCSNQEEENVIIHKKDIGNKVYISLTLRVHSPIDWLINLIDLNEVV